MTKIEQQVFSQEMAELEEKLARQTARGDAYARTCNEILEIGLRYRNALKFYGNPENWRFTHDKQGNILWVCSMGPDYALEILDDDELNAMKPHIGLRGIKELEEQQEAKSLEDNDDFWNLLAATKNCDRCGYSFSAEFEGTICPDCVELMRP